MLHRLSRIWLRSYSTQNKTVTHEIKNIGAIQKLYMTDRLTPGSIFFLPHGTRIFNRLVQFMKIQQKNFGFEEVITPLIYKKDLWKISGHWDHYKADMFYVDGTSDGSDQHQIKDQTDNGYSLKPMNCPGHCLMFASQDHSFRELPVRYSDFSPLHRNESSGALTGLTRVRKFHQDDGHIFCKSDQVGMEMSSNLKLMDRIYKIFGLDEYEMVLSTRPDSYIGNLESWNKAESDLKHVLEKSGKKWTLNEKDGAFYGPKIDVLVKDNLGKQHQTATIQLDFQLPENFNLKYSLSDQSKERPVLIHRAIFGSLERFLAILIDHYQGKWPFWLSPRQAIILPVASRHADYAHKLSLELSGKNNEKTGGIFDRSFYVDVDADNESISRRIKRALSLEYNYIILVGDKEVENETLTIRERGSRDTKTMKLEEVYELFCKMENEYR